MSVQVEVRFKVAHTLEELRAEFVGRGHIPDWKMMEGTETRPDIYFEDRVVSWELRSEKERYDWFVFSLEASGELRRRIDIHHVIPPGVSLDHPDLQTFLQFCRACLTGSPGR
ncbi:MAG: hypothetical protein HY823_02065 [Acidobacteria bacterium]|nr:hypothetical protein [Acidobacteriota bacterium]